MIRGVVLDLDGTVYRGDDAVPGAADFVRRARAAGVRVLFATNRSNRTPAAVAAHLLALGVPCVAAEVLTSAEVTGALLRGRRVYCIGERALVEALADAACTLADCAVDDVVVSFDREFTYAKLTTASRLIHGGARFVATNLDRALVTEAGLIPGTGALVAAVATATGATPFVVGKPEKWLFEMALQRLGLPASEVVAIGDNLETDVTAGARAGLRTVLMLTGVSRRESLSGAAVQPTWVAADYAELGAALRL